MRFHKHTIIGVLLSALLSSCALRTTMQTHSTEQIIYLDEIHVSTAYMDGGSYTISASTANGQNLYIYIDNSQTTNAIVRSEVAFLNSIELLNSPTTLSSVLLGMDSLYRQHFESKPAHELVEFITSNAATPIDKKIFSLVFFLENVCANQIFRRINEHISRNLDCHFYKPNSL